MHRFRARSSRRQVLLRGTGICAALACPSLSIDAADAITTERFLAISSKLCGVPLDDQDLAAQILSVLLAMPDVSTMAVLDIANMMEHVPASGLDDAITGAGLDRTAGRIVAAWYSGMAGGPGDERVLSFTGAAAWIAAGYDTPPTECAGFGAWSSPP